MMDDEIKNDPCIRKEFITIKPIDTLNCEITEPSWVNEDDEAKEYMNMKVDDVLARELFKYLKKHEGEELIIKLGKRIEIKECPKQPEGPYYPGWELEMSNTVIRQRIFVTEFIKGE
jgi:hypothetical protein